MTRIIRDVDRDAMVNAIIDAVQRTALGPDYKNFVTAHPLAAQGHRNESDDWWNTDCKSGRNRAGAPSITVWGADREWAATVMCTATGRNLTVYVPKGTRVVEVDSVE